MCGGVVQEGQITGTQIESKFVVYPDSGDVKAISGRTIGYTKLGGRASGGGYRMVSWRKNRRLRHLRVHHLVWAWVHGEWPKQEIDHINGDRADNRISNLRLATVSQNRTNKTISSNNKSGLKWVYFDSRGNCWRCDVRYRDGNNTEKRYSRRHKTAEAAYQDAVAFSKKVHGEWSNPGSLKKMEN